MPLSLLSSSSSLPFLPFFTATVDGTLFVFLPHSLGPPPFFPEPPWYLQLVRTLDSFFALTWKSLHASFVVPMLKYFLHSFNHTAAAKILVSPFFGSCFQHAVLGLGKIIFCILSNISSSDVCGFLSSMGFKNPSGIFSCTSRWAADFIMIWSISLSVTLASELMFVATILRCE